MQLTHRRLWLDTETPISALLKLAKDEPYAALFESVEGGKWQGRYSVLALWPDLIWRQRGTQAEIEQEGQVRADGSALASLENLLKRHRAPLPEGTPPMAAGLFGMLGYDVVRLHEPLGDCPNPAMHNIAEAQLWRPQIVVVFDHVEQVITLYHAQWPDSAHSNSQKLFDRVEQALRAPLPEPLPEPLPKQIAQHQQAQINQPQPLTSKADYLHKVALAKEYILSGDIFQLVLSQAFQQDFSLPPMALYRSLRRLNPSPFLFYLAQGDYHLVGSSPEILLRIRDKQLFLRPIAGTRPRGKTPALDAALATELLADPKERAEHLMLLDLGRNDVGRSAKIGSVVVTAREIVERYSHVMHIVSQVEGLLDDNIDVLQAVLNAFPAGTVTGAPKLRAMQIIDQLEDSQRQWYAGGIGYFGAGGDVDLCITLRTGLIKNKKLYTQAGAGIVYDSNPESEWQECRNKAAALWAAAEQAINFT